MPDSNSLDHFFKITVLLNVKAKPFPHLHKNISEYDFIDGLLVIVYLRKEWMSMHNLECRLVARLRFTLNTIELIPLACSQSKHKRRRDADTGSGRKIPVTRKIVVLRYL